MKDKHELQTFIGAIISLAVSRSIPHGGQKLIYQAGQKFRTDKQAARDDTSRWHNYCFPFDAARLTLEEPSSEPKEKKNRSKRSNSVKVIIFKFNFDNMKL